MPYVSAKYGHPDPIAPPTAPKPVFATDDQGLIWSLNENSQVGDWVDYIANGGTIDPADPIVISTGEVDMERDKRIDGGFAFDSKRYQSRPFDRDNISGATQAADLAIQAGAQPGNVYWQNPTQPFVWIAEDNSYTPMDAQTVVQFGQALLLHKQDHIFAARTLKETDPIPLDYTDDKYWPVT